MVHAECIGLEEGRTHTEVRDEQEGKARMPAD